MAQAVIDGTAHGQFVVSVGEATAMLEYDLEGGRLLLHTEVPEAFAARARAARWSKLRWLKPGQQLLQRACCPSLG